jgi:MoaA/NifB/PqqE/SkfB family radical SAM enzyme
VKLSGLHLLLTYQCNFECDHCFVWGSPWQSGTMTLQAVRQILQQAADLGSVQWIYFEGGEPFLYYAALAKGVQEAASMGFQVGIVSNGYWATDGPDALESLKPFAGLIQDLSVSSDIYHWSEKMSREAENACAAAEQLGIPVGFLSVAQPEVADAAAAVGQLPQGESAVMYRGRAAVELVSRAAVHPWQQFAECPFEDLHEVGRVHVDPFGNVQICQGISLGNLFETPLGDLCEAYDPGSHPIIGSLLEGGPAELVRRYNLAHEESYADACQLCYESCRSLRDRFPEILRPDQMYGVVED